jgi:hypothetical protein
MEETLPETPVQKPKPEPKPLPKPEPNPIKVLPDESTLGIPAWGDTSTGLAWTKAVRAVAAARLHELERASDKDEFCPGYAKASLNQRLNCWVEIVAAVSKFESNFKTDDSFREPDGHYSVGLLALSTGECPNAETVDELSRAVPNLVCGTNRMARLISQDGYIDGPDGHRGAAGYWSTLRSPYREWDATRKRYLKLGYKDQIMALIRNYRGTRPAPKNASAAEENELLSCRSVEELKHDETTGEDIYKASGFQISFHTSSDARGGVIAKVRNGGSVQEMAEASIVTVPTEDSGQAREIASALYPGRIFDDVKSVRIGTASISRGGALRSYTAYELLGGKGETIAKVLASGWSFARCRH